MAMSPLEQFTVTRIGPPLHLFGYDVSFTNSALWMCIVAGSAAVLLTVGAASRRLVPTRLQSLGEMSHAMIGNMIQSACGIEGLKFFPFVFTVFFFILFANLYGLLPFGLYPPIGPFTVTSHIIVTFALAIFIFLMVIVIGIFRNGFAFFRIFAPNVPWWMLILLIPIEIFSFCSRPISHSVRLAANMMAGHTMLNVFGGFVVGIAAAGGALSFLSIAPLFAISAVSALEFLIGFLQAYVFAILTCIYLNDALHPPHH